MSKELIQHKTGAASNIYEKIPDTNILNLIRDNITALDEIENTNSTIVIKASTDFRVIDSTKVYYIDGVIDMNGVTVEIPAGGISLIGSTFDISKLVKTDAGTDMFVSAAGGCGNILAKDLGIEASGVGSQIWNCTSLTGFEAFEFSRVNWNNCTKIGTLNNFRQGLETGTGRFGGTPTIELVGVWVGGYFIETSIVRSLTDGAYTLFKAGAGFLMSSRFRSNQNMDLPASVSFLDFAPANFVNPSTLQLDGCLVSRNGVFDSEDANLTPNIDEANLVSAWMGNTGIPNTFVGGHLNVTAEISTTISTINTPVPILGTFTPSNLAHFDEPANGQLRHLGNNPREFRFVGDLVIDGTSNDVFRVILRKWDNSAATFSDVGSQRRQVNNLAGGRDVAFFTIIDDIILDENDYLFLQIENQTAGRDATIELDSYFIISER